MPAKPKSPGNQQIAQPAGEMIAELIPMSFPARSTNALPLIPSLLAASVCKYEFTWVEVKASSIEHDHAGRCFGSVNYVTVIIPGQRCFSEIAATLYDLKKTIHGSREESITKKSIPIPLLFTRSVIVVIYSLDFSLRTVVF